VRQRIGCIGICPTQSCTEENGRYWLCHNIPLRIFALVGGDDIGMGVNFSLAGGSSARFHVVPAALREGCRQTAAALRWIEDRSHVTHFAV
jgi:hypothetical protein